MIVNNPYGLTLSLQTVLIILFNEMYTHFCIFKNKHAYGIYIIIFINILIWIGTCLLF